jgi:hypothetical protein
VSKTSKLIDDLSTLPAIVANLGLSIAAAQKAFNLTYLESVEQVIRMAQATLGEGQIADSAFSEEFTKLLKLVAPAHYQYTETELEFRADVAQTLNATVGVGLGVNVGAMTLNASVAVGFGYDYRAAARVKTVIHAVRPDQSVMNSLLDRADKLSAKDISLPEQAEVDKEIMNSLNSIFKTLTDKDAKAIGTQKDGTGTG